MNEYEGVVGQISLPHQAHYSMLPTSGYPLAGCSPAEPTSVSPDILILLLFFGYDLRLHCPSRSLASKANTELSD